MKKIYFIIICAIIINSKLLAYSSNPKDFVFELVNDAISKLSDKDTTQEQKSKFIEDIALENVDINALGLYTLGELRKSAEKSDIINYQMVFEKMITFIF